MSYQCTKCGIYLHPADFRHKCSVKEQEDISWKKINEKRQCDWCGKMKKVQQIEDTHYMVCIDCALSGL